MEKETNFRPFLGYEGKQAYESDNEEMNIGLGY